MHTDSEAPLIGNFIHRIPFRGFIEGLEPEPRVVCSLQPACYGLPVLLLVLHGGGSSTPVVSARRPSGFAYGEELVPADCLSRLTDVLFEPLQSAIDVDLLPEGERVHEDDVRGVGYGTVCGIDEHVPGVGGADRRPRRFECHVNHPLDILDCVTSACRR